MIMCPPNDQMFQQLSHWQGINETDIQQDLLFDHVESRRYRQEKLGRGITPCL